MTRPRPAKRTARAYDALDRIFHERARLAICATLAGRGDGVLFADLRDLCSLTDGNLSRHLQCLRESGVVEIWKGSRDGRGATLCRLSKKGRERFLAYLDALEAVVRDAVEAAKRAPAAGRPGEGFGRSGDGFGRPRDGFAPA
jgi:DNA-binding transcriptional ArsR family regulator